MSASVRRRPPWAVPRAFECFSSTRRPITNPAGVLRKKNGPRVSRKGLVRKSGSKPGGTAVTGSSSPLADRTSPRRNPCLEHARERGACAEEGILFRARPGEDHRALERRRDEVRHLTPVASRHLLQAVGDRIPPSVEDRSADLPQSLRRLVEIEGHGGHGTSLGERVRLHGASGRPEERTHLVPERRGSIERAPKAITDACLRRPERRGDQL